MAARTSLISLDQSRLSSDSFVSAPDSPNEIQRQILENKLKMKKQKQAQKKFN